MTDPRRDDAVWRDLLTSEGVPAEDIDRAEADGPLEVFVLERFILQETAQFDIEEVSKMAGIPVADIRAFWRALGFPDPQTGVPTFTTADLDMLTTAMEFVRGGDIEMTVALQMARVIGSSLSRIAVAQTEITNTRPSHVLDGSADPEDLERAAELLPMLSTVIDSVWRRHLAVASRRQILRDDQEEAAVTVGFADMEGFTSLSQQLPEEELAAVVSQFEQIAYDVVSRLGGRVVKMIGDEVMFTAEGPLEGVELALTLAEAYSVEDALGDVRVGLATGPALQLEGDLYGPAVNLASRIVSIAYPGSVVVPREVVDAVEASDSGTDAAGFEFRQLRPHHLRHIGRVRLWSVRRSSAPGAEVEGATLDRARDRRAARRAWIAERMSERRSGGDRGDTDTDIES
jgi:adenylate cyclase